VPYNLFKLFLVHKISAYNYICGNGKKKWEKKKEKGFPARWAGGCFRPSRARARARARQAAQPAHEEGGVNGAERAMEGGEPVGSTAGDARGGSPPGSRFRIGEVVARHGWG
jgi:hypothetical protein